MTTTGLYDIVRRWRKCNLEAPPYLFPDDSLSALQSLATGHRSFKAYISSPEFGSGHEHALHIGLLPMPYAGNLAMASVFILMLNPGLSPGDYYAEHQPEFRRAHIRTLRQENAGDPFPFVFLDPRFSWHPGFGYWHNKFRAVIAALSGKRGVTYQQAMSTLARELACLELLPYHSKSFGAGTLLSRLPSAVAMRAFVHDALLPKVKEGDALIIATRSAATWDLPHHKRIVVYDAGEARSAHLTPASRGGRAIMQHLGL